MLLLRDVEVVSANEDLGDWLGIEVVGFWRTKHVIAFVWCASDVYADEYRLGVWEFRWAGERKFFENSYT